MHAYRAGSGQGAGRTRLLYMFRSPANRKVGRNLLDPEVMEALEHTHPDLTFDWQAMQRASALAAAEPERDRDRDRERDRDRDRRHRQDKQDRQDKQEKQDRQDKHDRSERDRQDRDKSDRAARSERGSTGGREPGSLVELDDQSLLGKALGAAEAAQMRSVYAELVQRVARRSRNPEERDRLTERVGRLNPDEWQDDAAIAAAVSGFAAECEAIRQELPRRRRGRRGGRAKDRETGGAEPGASDGFGVVENDADEREMVESAGADDRSLDSGVGAEPDATGPTGHPVHDSD